MIVFFGDIFMNKQTIHFICLFRFYSMCASAMKGISLSCIFSQNKFIAK